MKTWQQVASISERMDVCFHLREKGYIPYAACLTDAGYEYISFPFPDDHDGISIMVRRTNEPTTMVERVILESEWFD